jgi:transposase
MEHLAIDLGGKESQICIRSADGAITLESRKRTIDLSSFLATRPPSRVILETCAEAFAIAEAALSLGHEVRVVPATLVRSLGVGERKLKSDRRDAQKLSEVSSRIDLPTVHIPSPEARDWKSQLGARDSLVKSRTVLVNNARGWARGRLLRIGIGGPESFPKRFRERCKATGIAIPEFVEFQLTALEQLNEQIAAATKAIYKAAKSNEHCKKLMTTPGVGAMTALRFVATIDELERFESAHRLESYLGLTPGEDSSSERQRTTSITKAGATKMRWLLIQASWSFLRTRPEDPAIQWATKIAQRRGKRVAIVALARKLAGILFAIWRDGSEYRPERSARVAVAAVN